MSPCGRNRPLRRGDRRSPRGMPGRHRDAGLPTGPGELLVEHAPAKINLTLRVRGRRHDGYHDIESLVAFARVADRLTLAPCGPLELRIRGPYAGATGTVSDNLVLAAAQTLVRKVQELKLGRFVLDKRLPVAAG